MMLEIQNENKFLYVESLILRERLINAKPFNEKIAYTETANPLDADAPPKQPNTKSVRTSKWKLICNEYNNTKELYNLEKDPTETNNLINSGLEIEEFLWNEFLRIQNGGSDHKLK